MNSPKTYTDLPCHAQVPLPLFVGYVHVVARGVLGDINVLAQLDRAPDVTA